MMDGIGLKKKSLNKNIIKIYQMPLIERILAVFSAVVLTSIPILSLFLGFEQKLGMIILFLCMILYCIFIFMIVFKTYIFLDIDNQKIIIRENPGNKKKELPLNNLIDISVVNDPKNNRLFTINFNYTGYVHKIISWSAHPSCRLVMFNVYGRQTRRLKKFIFKCNLYFKNKQ